MAHGGMALVALIVVAAVANLNLAVANVALPSIGRAFDASQTSLDLISVGYSLGLAASVLYLGAVGDRYGRKLMLIVGVCVSVPACLIAAYAPDEHVLVAARLLGGLAAGMAYPTTLALITALWAGAARTRRIAIWSGVGAAISTLGPVVSGWLLLRFWWGSVFLVTLPLAAVAIILALRFVPAHVNETTAKVDHRGGVLSVIMVAGIVLAINLMTSPSQRATAWLLLGIGVLGLVAFVWRQRRTDEPLFDLAVAGRRVFWVAAVAGIIVFGSLMGAMFVGQQFLQNVLSYSTLEAGAAIVPGAALMIVAAPISARLVIRRGARLTLLIGYAFCLAGFLVALLTWREGVSRWPVVACYALVGAGVGFAGTPASHSLTSSVPVRRAGMASATADLQRDLGGALMQSLLGALLTAGYAHAFSQRLADAPNAADVSSSVASELEKSFSSAADTALRYPQYAEQIIAAAKDSFVHGADWSFLTAIIAVLIGAVIVAVFFPKKAAEEEALRRYRDEDVTNQSPPR